MLLTLALLTAPTALAADLDPAQVALDALAASSPQVAMHTQSVRASFPWAAGTRVRVAQRVFGLPLVNGEQIVSLDLNDEVTRIDGPTFSLQGFDPSPDLMDVQAADALTAALLQRTGAAGLAWEPRTELVAALDQRGELRLAWQVDATTHTPFAGYQALVDAHTGVIFGLRATTFSAGVEVYETSPFYGSPIAVDLPGLIGEELITEWAVTRSCDSWSDQTYCSSKSQHAVADENGDFVFPPDALSTDDPFAEVQMLYHLDLVGHWFSDHFDLDIGRIEGLVNFRYNNAFFGDADGDGVGEVAFGQNSSIDFAYDADVIYHEYGHAAFGSVVSQTGFFESDEYGLIYASASLNEGTADVFSMAITGDPTLGEYSGRAFPPYTGPVRDLDQDLRCPNDLYGESHKDGEVWAAFAWRLMDDERVGADVTADLIWGALTSWPSEVTWQVAGDSLVTVSEEMRTAGVIDDTTHGAIAEHLDNTTLAGCGRVVSLDTGAEPTQIMFHPGFFGPDANIPVQNQFSIEASDYATEVTVEVSQFQSNASQVGWNLYVRRGEHVVHDLVDAGFGGFQRPQPTTYDFVVSGTGPSSITLELADPEDPEDLPEYLLEPGATYYFSVASNASESFQGFASAEIAVRASVEEVIPEDTGRACGCASGGSGAGWFALMLPLLGLRRRR